jgi:hypothetical protein
MKRIVMVEKGNGFMLSEQMDSEGGSGGTWETIRENVVEGKDAKKIGAAALALFKKPRGPRKRPAPKAVA